jgi:ribose transport system ATP-binding protein/L-arabinose transport system ATP-binding protein
MATEAYQQNGMQDGRPAAGGSPDTLISIRGLGKHFAGEVALNDVDMDIRRGEVHGLVGANGAGKSTLIRCLAGVTVPDHGTITVAGQELKPGSPQAAEKAGLAFIHQELNLVPHFNAIENILLGAPKVTRLGMIDWKRSSVSAKAAAKRVGIKFSLERRVSELSIAERWLVMISKALVREASMIAMDEPTASLSNAETEQLFSIVRDLAADGVAILYVSHRLDEVLNLCDRITVFRDGQVVARATRGDLNKKGLIRAIVGHDIKSGENRRSATVDRTGTPLFSARNLKRGVAVRDVSFDVHKGEILALGGLVGSGRTEVARLAFGVDQPQVGHFEMAGKRLEIPSESAAIKAGIALVSEERRSQGLMPDHSVGFNINVASLTNLRVMPNLPFLSFGRMRGRAEGLVKQLGIKTPGIASKIIELSGGNQQKAMIARWLGPDIRLLILDEPSRGVDIGAREEIHDVIRELAAKGVGIIVISSDVEELAILADRVVVLHEGKVAGELVGKDITEARIIALSYLDVSEMEGETT